jgi:hypothetical protein
MERINTGKLISKFVHVIQRTGINREVRKRARVRIHTHKPQNDVTEVEKCIKNSDKNPVGRRRHGRPRRR